MRENFWRVFWGLILIVVGGLYLLDNIGLIDFELWSAIGKLWPVALIFVGLLIIFSRGGRSKVTTLKDGKSLSRVVGDIDIQISPKDIDGTRFSSFIGDMEFRLTDGGLNEGENKMVTSTFIGDINMTVPRGLPIQVRFSSFLGDFKIYDSDGTIVGKESYKSTNYDESSSKLFVHCSTFIGDFKLHIQ